MDPSLATPTPIFKNSNNQLYTKRLFFEMCPLVNDKSTCIYTLKDFDHSYNGETYISLYQRYLDLEDTLEFDFANQYFESYEHFKILCQCEWFKPHIYRWRNELRLKLRSRAVQAIKSVSTNPQDKNYFEANKLILNGNLDLQDGKKSKGPGRGRPSNDEIALAVKEIAKEDQSLADDHNRVFS